VEVLLKLGFPLISGRVPIVPEEEKCAENTSVPVSGRYMALTTIVLTSNGKQVICLAKRRTSESDFAKFEIAKFEVGHPSSGLINKSMIYQ